MLLIDACTLAPIIGITRYQQPVETTMTSDYVDRMVVPASHLAALLRDHLPGASPEKLHRLLYYIQGHHLALRGRPAFTEQIFAGPNGPQLGHLDGPSTTFTPPEPVASTLLMVITRYGYLTVNDLNRLATAEPPWRGTPAGQEIDRDAMRAFFAGEGAQEGTEQFGPEYLAYLRREVNQARTRARSEPAPQAIGLDELLARVAGHGSR